MKRSSLDHAVILAAVMAVLAFAHEGWLVKFCVATSSLVSFIIHTHHKRLYGLSLYLLAVLALYICADILTFNNFSPDAILSYIILCISIGYCIIIGKNKRNIRILFIVANLLFIIIPLFYVTYYVVFSTGVTRDVYYGMLQTNMAEAIEFARNSGIANHLPIPVLCLVIITFFLCRYLYGERVIEKRTRKMFLLVSLIAAVGWSGHPRIAKDMGAYTLRYYNRMRLFKRRTSKRNIANRINFTATKKGKGETYLVVIGESLNRHHMQIYGYPRATTPALATEKELLVFRNTYSSHIHTSHALAEAFTTSNQYNKIKWFESVSIIDVLQKARIKTFWLSNQNLFGFWINVVTLFAKQADYHYHLGDAFYESPHFDEVLLPHVSRILKTETQTNRVIFAHLHGNHIDYCLRFPPTYARFKGRLPTATHGILAQGEASHQKKINCYDNSVLYNDFVVSQMLAMLKNIKGVRGFIYFSDHAVDILADREKMISSYSYEMTSIPFVAWFSEEYRNKYLEVYQNLKNNSVKLFSNDMLYDTLLGIFAIKTNQYNARADLSSTAYSLEEDEALVLSGERKYGDKANTRWQQKKRIADIIAHRDGSKVIPAQVNNIGKLLEIWRDGYRSFAVDLFYKDMCLTVGQSNMCLQNFLAHVSTNRIEKLWLQIKDFRTDDARYVLTKLRQVEDIVAAEKIIVETSNCINAFKFHKQNGWHVSCYLSPQQVKSLSQKNVATKLALQLRERVNAISFDGKVYPQVKKYLAKLLPAEFVFHIYRRAGVANINKSKYWSDERVETIAFRYDSLFQLPPHREKNYAARRLPAPP